MKGGTGIAMPVPWAIRNDFQLHVAGQVYHYVHNDAVNHRHRVLCGISWIGRRQFKDDLSSDNNFFMLLQHLPGHPHDGYPAYYLSDFLRPIKSEHCIHFRTGLPSGKTSQKIT